MRNKRKSTLNDFRFYPVFQKRVELKLSNGNVIEDYKNEVFFPSNYKIISAMEAGMNQARRIEAKVRVMGRYLPYDIDTGTDKKNGDRLFYPDTGTVLRISDATDPTNRREYINLLCVEGAYTTRGVVQPSPKITILKVLAASDDDFIALFSFHISNEPSDMGAFIDLGSFDTFYKPEDIQYINQSGSTKNLYLLLRLESDTSQLSSHFDNYSEINVGLSAYRGVLIKEDVSSYLTESPS